jgi:hypothetical protein
MGWLFAICGPVVLCAAWVLRTPASKRQTVLMPALLLAVAFVPLSLMLWLQESRALSPDRMGTVMLVLMLVSAAVFVSAVVVMARNRVVWCVGARGSGEAAAVSRPVVTDVATFQFRDMSWGFGARATAACLVVSLVQEWAKGRTGLNLLLPALWWTAVFLGLVAMLVAAVRRNIDVLGDRLRVERDWLNSRSPSSALEIPVSAIARISVGAGGILGESFPTVDVVAADRGVSLPFDSANRAEAGRCLVRLLEVVPSEIVEDGVVHFGNAVALLESAENDSVAGKALRLISRNRLKEAARLLAEANREGMLGRAASDLLAVLHPDTT